MNQNIHIFINQVFYLNEQLETLFTSQGSFFMCVPLSLLSLNIYKLEMQLYWTIYSPVLYI